MNLVQKLRRTLRTWTINAINTLVYILTGGRKTLHEGHYVPRRNLWINWSRMFESQPEQYETPQTEEELCQAVKSAEKVRVVGGGHTFNASPLTDRTMLSLDAYNKLLSVDQDKKIVRVQAGIRLRDLNEQLQALGLGLPLLGSADTQSLGGLIATDLHGTGRKHGFLSEQVLSLRIVNSAGEARTFRRGDDTFHAAIGAIGMCGLVTEVELQCVSAFNLARSVQVVHRDWIDTHLDRLLEEHDHLSFYYIGGVDIRNVRMNLWDESPQKPSFAWKLRKLVLEVVDMGLTGYLLNLARALKVADLFANAGLFAMKLLLNHDSIVMPSAQGFTRKLYFHHNEMEYGVPYAVHRECLNEILAVLRARRYVTIVEARFTPERSQALIGPGVGRRSCFIDITPSFAADTSAIYAELEPILQKYGGQPHLGKSTSATGETLRAIYKERWDAFRKVQHQQDPSGKFANEFVARLLDDGRTMEEQEAARVREPLRVAS